MLDNPLMLVSQAGYLSVVDLARLSCVCRSANDLAKHAPRLLWDDGARCGPTGLALRQAVTRRNEHLLVLQLRQCQELGEEDLVHLRLCKGLQELVLTDALRLSDMLFAHTIVPSLRRLQKVDVSGSDVGDDSLVALAEACPQLVSLNVAGCLQVTTLPGQFAQLQWLDVSETAVTDAGLRPLGALCGNLLHLFLSNTEVGDEGLALVVAAHSQLRSLDIAYTHVTGEVVAMISTQCPQLESVNISGCDVKNDALDSFARESTKLVSLCATDLPFCLSTALVTIAECCTNLETLSLSSCHCVYEHALQLVRKMRRRLRHFFASHCFWFDNRLLHTLLQNLSDTPLEHLDLVSTNVTDIDLCTELVLAATSLHTLGLPHYVFSHATTLLEDATARNIMVYCETDAHDDDDDDDDYDDCSSCEDSDAWLAANVDESKMDDMIPHSWCAPGNHGGDSISCCSGSSDDGERDCDQDNVVSPLPTQAVPRVLPISIRPFALRQHRSVSIMLRDDDSDGEDNDDQFSCETRQCDGSDSEKENITTDQLKQHRDQCHSDEPLSPRFVLVRRRLQRRSSAPACLGQLLHNMQEAPERAELQPWRRYWPIGRARREIQAQQRLQQRQPHHPT